MDMSVMIPVISGVSVTVIVALFVFIIADNRAEKRKTAEKAPAEPAPAAPVLIKCEVCGADISRAAKACPHCGHPVKQEIHQDHTGRKWAITIPVVAVIALIVIIFSVLVANSRKVDFADLRGQLSPLCSSISADGKSITVDSDPRDTGTTTFLQKAEQDILTINEKYGLPDALYERMMHTRALDGTQEATYGNIRVTWTYHPDNGLNVIYEVIK